MSVYSNTVQITVVGPTPTAPTPARITLKVSPSSGSNSTTFTASGSVQASDGTYLAGVSVYVFIKQAAAAGWTPVGSATTDSDGDFSVQFTVGAFYAAPSAGKSITYDVIASDSQSGPS